MGKFLKENYYILVRMILMLIYGMYGLSGNVESAGVPLRILLLLALYISVMTIKELTEAKLKLFCLAVSLVINILLIYTGGSSFTHGNRMRIMPRRQKHNAVFRMKAMDLMVRNKGPVKMYVLIFMERC